MLDLTLLGTGGTMPVKGRRLSAGMVCCQGACVLLDCGEGTQTAAREAGLSLSSIDMICLTHLHGDHLFGLPGLLLSMGNEERTRPVRVLGPMGTERYVSAICSVMPALPFPLEVHSLPHGSATTLRLPPLSVTAFPVQHTIPCFGYALEVPRTRRFDPALAKANQVPLHLWHILQHQDTATDEERVYTSDMVLTEPRKGLKLVYATDTRPCPALAAQLRGADLAVLEGMFGDSDKQERAFKTGHMTFPEAAELCRETQPSRAVLTHYSPSLPDPEVYLEKAQTVFPRLCCGSDGMRFSLRFQED